jgi:hypothetical protein
MEENQAWPEIRIVTDKISKSDLGRIAEGQYGDMVKAVVDIYQKVMAVGGELHSDEESALIQQGSQQENLWGINLYPEQESLSEFIEFDSLINIRPKQGNRSRLILDSVLQKQIIEIVQGLVS